jgi:hypothetical protein
MFVHESIQKHISLHIKRALTLDLSTTTTSTICNDHESELSASLQAEPHLGATSGQAVPDLAHTLIKLKSNQLTLNQQQFSVYILHTLDSLKKLGLDSHKAIKLGLKFH